MKYNFYKWRIWSILAISFVMSLFQRGAVGVISSDISRDLGLTATELGNVASIAFYTYAFMQIPAGLLLDYFGYKKISFYGILTTGIGSIILGLATNVFGAYSGRFLVGLGTSVIFIAVLKAQTIWFRKDEFTKASGKLSFIGNLGGVIATFPLAFLVYLLGWRYSMIFMGAICIIISILIALYVKNSPCEYGFEPEGSEIKNVKVDVFKAIKRVIKIKEVWRGFFILFTLVGCTTTITGLWGINYLTSVYKVSTGKASFIVAFIIYGLVCGSLFVDKAIKIFKNNIIIYPRIAAVINSIIWIYILVIRRGVPTLTELSIVFFIMGFLAMAHIIAFTDINNYCESENSGLASSIVNSGEFIGSSIISLVIGFILDISWRGEVVNGVRVYSEAQYKGSFYIFLIISVIGIFVTFIGNKKVVKTK